MRVQPRAADLVRAIPTLPSRDSSSFFTSVWSGGLYVALSLASSSFYLCILQPAFANDFWWTRYDASTHQALLVDLFNSRLATQATGTVDLLAPRASVDKAYVTRAAWTPNFETYARRLVLSDLTSVDYAVVNLRALDSHHCMWMATQYCWVDLRRQFSVAHTAARDQRCLDAYTANGAVYMETVVRNQVWSDFVQNYGGPGGVFTVAVQAWLEQTPAGVAWLMDTSTARAHTSVAAEAAHWQAHGIARFQLQWQNLLLVGLSETMTIVNALQWPQTVALKHLPATYEAWTTVVMYWMPLKDLSAMQSMNQSLIRSANNSFERASFSFETSLGLVDAASGRYVDQVALFRSTVGPFNSIDIFVVPVPAPVLAVYGAFATALYEAMAAQPRVRAAVDAIADFALAPTTPPAWTTVPPLRFHGGNPMCLTGAPLAYIQQTVDNMDNCATQTRFELMLSKYSSVFAALMSPTTSVCTSSSSASCNASIESVTLAVAALPPSVAAAIAPLAGPAADAVHGTDVGIMQYASTRDATWQLLQQPLLQDISWANFGWAMVFDWVEGRREVLSFQGDVASIVVISTAEHPQSFPSSAVTVKTATQFIYVATVYVTVLLVVVGVVCLLSAISVRGHVHGRNLVWFNRVVGSMWVGRSLLFIRGCTAVLMLSTSPLQPTTSYSMSSSPHTRFAIAPLSWLATCVVAGEATWISYVMQDLLTVVAGDLTPTYGPVSCFVAWVVLAVVDRTSPVLPVATLARACVSVGMDQFVQCETGTVVIGSAGRVALLVGIQLVTLAIVLGLLCVHRATHHRRVLGSLSRSVSVMDRHLLGAADAFLESMDDCDGRYWSLDKVSCVMVGLVPLTIGNTNYTFDVKLWVFQRDTLSTPTWNTFEHYLDGAAVQSTWDALSRASSILTTKASTSASVLHSATTALGVLYAVAAIVGSISYVQVSQVSLANDLFWTSFNMTGAHAFLANWYNEQLVLGVTNATLTLSTASINQDGAFDQPTVAIMTPTKYGGVVQQAELKSLAAAIAGLRSTDPCLVPWIFTQYCYVDLTQRFEMANSAARQVRCRHMTTNGAVFLETLVRNIPFDAFTACWGDAFDVAIASELRRSDAGRSWLATTTTTTKIAASAELYFWTSFGVEKFETQWQNFKLVGLHNTYSVTNVFGLAYPFTLQSQTPMFRLDKQTTFKMYWGLGNDFMAAAHNQSSVAGLSLVRSSPRFAFANTSVQALLIENGTLASPFGTVFTLLSTTALGSFGSVDMNVIPCPVEATAAVHAIYETLRDTLAHDRATQVAYSRIVASWSMYPVPKAWTDENFIAVSGSLLCPEYPFASSSPIAAGFTELTSWEFGCFISSTTTYLDASSKTLLASAILANITSPTSPLVAPTCAQNVAFQASCVNFLTQLAAFIDTAMAPADLARLADASAMATRAIRGLNVTFTQFGMRDANASVALHQLNVLDPTQVEFTFFAWVFLLDWTIGKREAVSFEGDAGTMVILTDFLDATAEQVSLGENCVNLSFYLRNVTLYVTSAMIVLATLVSIYVVVCRSHVEIINLFFLERVGAIVWVGRPFLFVRSLTAIGLLSTCSLQLATTSYISFFRVVDLPAHITFLAANEVTWLVAIVNDMAMLVTQEFTSTYGGWDSVCVWLATAVISLTNPVTHAVTIDKHCAVVHTDFEIECSSGIVTIGNPWRLVALVTLVVCANVACYVVTRLWFWHFHTRPKSIAVSSIFVYGGAKFLFRKAYWMHGGVYYMDRMSAVLNGILTLRWRNTIYGLDIKLWRRFYVQLPRPSGDDVAVDQKLTVLTTSAFPIPHASNRE
ncbi:Aste57867_15278 [Aphanomyces stellatus]|uniref:Aste57867_15278 protein n=1 Tax=Aphanomyces stellatus TaxID=120398 RepID=A0A485L3R6_9STRA|nr:hypothetical protein As57867_015222 [Aphanomyces stellatus]VFT92087.1 Aste57867_15278 [Aphanomyces stellatus]